MRDALTSICLAIIDERTMLMLYICLDTVLCNATLRLEGRQHLFLLLNDWLGLPASQYYNHWRVKPSTCSLWDMSSQARYLHITELSTSHGQLSAQPTWSICCWQMPMIGEWKGHPTHMGKLRPVMLTWASSHGWQRHYWGFFDFTMIRPIFRQLHHSGAPQVNF